MQQNNKGKILDIHYVKVLGQMKQTVAWNE